MMGKVRPFYLAVAMAMTPGMAFASELPWEGVWTAEPDWCIYADKIGSHTPAPIRLTREMFEGYENSCQVIGASQIGATPSWTIDMECQSEGSTYDERILVIVESSTRIWQVFPGLEAIAFDRCEMPAN